MDNKIEQMKEVIEILNKASKLYYQYNTSMMTDFEYDKLYDKLVELEKETNTTLSNSPTINVETEIVSSLEKYPHPKKMLSLAKTKDINQFVEFLGHEIGILSWKLDGLTVVLTYEDGNLVRGVTRGNGTVGEVVTDNVKRFKNIPLTIPYLGSLIIRGEAIIKYSDFNKINEDLKSDEDQYKNPRNLCSGSVRQLNSEITAERNINFVVFTLVSADEPFISKIEQLKWLKALGFEIVDHVLVNKTNLENKVKEFENRVKKYDVPSDGLVLTFDSIPYSISLGSTVKHPKDSLAFKWQDETYETELKEVTWSVSRTGLINPVAVFSPVKLEGTNVSRASLHNLSIIERLQLGIGDTIEVYKANMIIPQVASNLTKSNTLEIPVVCPVCNQKTEIRKINDIKYLYCTNNVCAAKLLKRFSLFTSRNGMNMEGISDATLSLLINEGLLTSFSDLYKLSKFKERIMQFEGFGKKSYENMIASIEKSRNVKLANFIYALGIPEIGLSRAKLICEKSNNDYEVVKNYIFEDLSAISGIGDVIAKEWITAFNNDNFVNEADKVVHEIRFIDESNIVEATLADQTFVITGNLHRFKNRKDLIDCIEKKGGKVVGSISSKVDYLVNNDINSNSTKNRKAKELGIEIIDEEKLLELIEKKVSV